MSTPTRESLVTGNLFLDALPDRSVALLSSKLERVSVCVGQPVARVGMPLEHVVFPIASVVSAVAVMLDGSQVEVALIGRDGFYGMQVALGDEGSPNEAMIQIADSALRMRSADFVRCLEADAALLRQVLRYVHVSLITAGQFSACNRLHGTNERCARWLLMAHDRVAGDELSLTHEYLATMLGVRRPGVSLAAAALDEAGLIAYRRGRISVLDRPGLQRASCECYRAVNDAARRILGYDIRKHAG